MAGEHGPDVRTGRLQDHTLRENFSDVHPPLDRRAAVVEASRCYFCYDAPCVEACPTGIDIPQFIRSIQTENVAGAAQTIFEANIMGGMCARVCPVEELCEQACVRTAQDHRAVTIGALQRYATDHLLAGAEHPFRRAAPSGKTVAVVGAGPAGLACAHRCAMLGHDVVVFEAREKGGGLNEYGIAAYKTANQFAQKELAFILDICGIKVRYGQALGADITLGDLRTRYDAVFLGMGHVAVRSLGLENEDLGGVENAVDYIAALRQAPDPGRLPVGRNVVVLGGGNTAIDIATQIKLLGAENVTIVYRRGPQHMPATDKEQAWAQTNGVVIKHFARPVRLIAWSNGGGHNVKAVECEYTQLDENGRLMGTGDTFTVAADQVFKAIGQYFLPSLLGGADVLDMDGERIAVNQDRQTSIADVFAGGDCVSGVDLTVSAVEDGKRAAIAIDRTLRL